MRALIKFLIICIITLALLPSVAIAKSEKNATAIFAGGCFWCVEADLDKVPGVIKTFSGYTGGALKNPTYEQVSVGNTGHYEAVAVVYDPNQVSYQQLLSAYWHSIDPTDAHGQFCDHGDQYRSVIFYANKEQKALAEKSKSELVSSGKFKEIDTQILPVKTFYLAEEYHQDYYHKNPVRYKYYRYRCGRDQRVHEVWNN